LLIMVFLVNIVKSELSFGTGSSRLEDKQATDFNEFVEDKEHIKEEFEDLFTDQEINDMEHDMIAFSWFTAHNDGDEGLDGLEMLKAMLHHNHKGHEALEDNSDPVIHKTEEEVIALVDSLIENYDENENGLLEYAEFMKAFEETQATLGI